MVTTQLTYYQNIRMRLLWVFAALALLNAHLGLKLLLIHHILSYGRRQRRLIVGNSLPLPILSLSLPPPRTRQQWVKVRSRDWWERVVLMEFTDSEWRDNFRMSRSSFSRLCDVVGPYMRPEEATVRPPIPLPMRVAIVLYKLGSCGEYRLVANQFGVHKSTVKKFVYMFCRGMVEHRVHQFIKVPDVQQASEIASRFQKAYGLPQVIGCVDGTHIPILPPSDGYRDFVNRKGWPSYVLQGVVDDNCCFWTVNCRVPGSAHDAHVLRLSELYKQAHRLPKRVMEVEGVGVNFFIIGDPAYPLLDWLMKGYTRARGLTAEEESLNVYLSAARTCVEMAFGRLKARWRILLKRMDIHYTFSPYVIVTCCALHNFCEQEKDTANPGWLQEATSFDEQLPQPGNPPVNNMDGNGQMIREALKCYMAANFPLRRGVTF